MAAPDSKSGDIRKFEHIGTRSIAIEQGIGQAIDFHQMIGTQRKEARLRYLKHYWAAKVLQFKGVSINTPMNPKFSGAIALLAIEGKTPQEVARYLKNKHQIHSVAIVWENISGVRITPNVYTLTTDLDRLVNAVKVFTKR